MLYRKREISATPIQFHLKELYGERYPQTLAPNPEMKAVSYAGKTFGRYSIIFFLMDKTNWTNIFKSVQKTCRENRVREFHVKFIHRIVGTKKELFRFNIKSDSNFFFYLHNVNLIIYLIYITHDMQYTTNNYGNS